MKARDTEGWLIPGVSLHERIRGHNNKSRSRTICVLVGDAFERLSANVSGAPRLTTDSESWCCPDLHDDEQGIYYESKAAQRYRGFKLMASQFEAYESLLRDEPNASVKYYLWTYSPCRLAVEQRTKGALYRFLSQSIQRLTVLDFDAVRALYFACPGTSRHTQYSSWHGNMGGAYRAFLLSQPTLDELWEAPEAHLDGWGLDTSRFVCKYTTVKDASFSVEDIEFNVAPFDVLSCESVSV